MPPIWYSFISPALDDQSCRHQQSHGRAPSNDLGFQLVVGRGGDYGYFDLGGLGVVEVCKFVYSLFGPTLSHWGLYRKQPRGAQAFHHIAVAVLSVSTIAYYAMASDLGQTPVRTEFRSGPDRSIFVGFVSPFPAFFVD